MNDVVVTVRGATRTYNEETIPVHALRGVDLEVHRGDFISLAGPSGSGKSTLLNLIGGLDQADEGDVIVDQVSLSELNENQLSDLRLEKIGFVFQAYNLLPVLTAEENVGFVMQLQGMSKTERSERARETLASVGLEDLADRRPGDMSGGQQQRVAIARAIATKPVLLLADEPSANLDSGTTEELLQLLKKLNEEFGMTIVTATHDPMVMAYTSRKINLRDGAIVVST
ncbi:MAG: macrolide ABC transporter ATP-binding protein [Gammaproteobacteria bacterium]|jgi:putative ABC transport system ATP-binding protein|nr:macrolide ABC transporter ATP-binding protein [Gammaproteobacteria bacterium]|tara:strand:- start:1353 stop:2036 length:684 start_codon:yes stop_codon:yes gene_type:complete